MRVAWPIAGVLAALLAGCAAAPRSSTSLTIFAASSLTDAFTEIGAAYDAEHPTVDVAFSFGGSQTLRTQIEAGAPVDVFASADGKHMEALVAGGLVKPEAVRPFLSNSLVVILPAANLSGIRNLRDLSKPGLKLVLAAQEVPVGNYARQSLEKMDSALGPEFSRAVLGNVVSNEDNVKQVVAKVQLGEADGGIVYASDATAAPKLKIIEIPAEFNVIASYPIAPLVRSGHPIEAASFVEYVLSEQGQAILSKWGFAPAGQ